MQTRIVMNSRKDWRNILNKYKLYQRQMLREYNPWTYYRIISTDEKGFIVGVTIDKNEKMTFGIQILLRITKFETREFIVWNVPLEDIKVVR